jgi:hypothetical protein
LLYETPTWAEPLGQFIRALPIIAMVITSVIVALICLLKKQVSYCRNLLARSLFGTYSGKTKYIFLIPLFVTDMNVYLRNVT